jgi:hypothetical protein
MTNRCCFDRSTARRAFGKFVQVSVPVAGLVACACGIILVLGVVSAGVLSVMGVFIPCAIIGGISGLWLIIGSMIGNCMFDEESPEAAPTRRFRTRPSTYAVQRRMDVVQRLEHVNDTHESERTCSICLCETPPERVVLPCGHKFHENCVKEWMTRARFARCPLCRGGLSTPLQASPGDQVTPDAV